MISSAFHDLATREGTDRLARELLWLLPDDIQLQILKGLAGEHEVCGKLLEDVIIMADTFTRLALRLYAFASANGKTGAGLVDALLRRRAESDTFVAAFADIVRRSPSMAQHQKQLDDRSCEDLL